MAHILLKNIISKLRELPVPASDFYYDIESGYWLSISNATLLVFNSTFMMLGSKKRDLETGEDQK